MVSRDEDPIRRQELDSTITAKLTHAGMHAFFTQVLNQQQVVASVTVGKQCWRRGQGQRWRQWSMDVGSPPAPCPSCAKTLNQRRLETTL